MVVILMGVAGSGKTTIGRALAAGQQWPFVDADDYHSPQSIAKMRSGTPLSDADRAPWLAALHALIARALDRREPLVLACSALRQQYRQALGDGIPRVRFVHLTAPETTLRERLANRRDHFVRSNLLESQLATLEPPTEALVIDSTRPISVIIRQICCEFGL